MSLVHEIMATAAESLGRSFAYYWPADAAGVKDPAENNLALHLAHALLSRDYAVFAEVDHPDRTIQGIDLLAIAEDRSRFFAVELKRHFKAAGMGDSLDDVGRLIKFRLHRRLFEERCGVPTPQIISDRIQGFGVVAGVRWYAGATEPDLSRDPVANRVRGLNGEVDRLELHRSVVADGAYWLQYGCFPLATAVQ